MEWDRSRHAAEDVGCIDCHGATEGEVDAWRHEGAWIATLVTPKDCATCHISGYLGSDGEVRGGSHDVGRRISWTLRPVVSTKLNLVIHEDGFQEDLPDTRPLPAAGDTVETTEKYAADGELRSRTVPRKVARIETWQERRAAMQAVCANCHQTTFVRNFYTQFDSLVTLYNDKFAKPARQIMADLKADGVLNPNAPFEHNVQWVFWELWHHEGRRARHGASMMGPDYTHWHGMYEVSKHFYTEFLPAVIEAAATKGPEMEARYRARVDRLLTAEEHLWRKGLSPEEAAALREMYENRYGE